MRYFLTGRLPAITGVLLIESGRREILERLIPALRRIWGDAVQLDLLTCYPGLPAGSALTGDIGSAGGGTGLLPSTPWLDQDEH